MNNKIYKNFYVNDDGSRRKFAIFAPGLDRFILTDTYDRSILLQIAELLSSKLPTLVYILPKDNNLTDSNCINYTIFNKTKQTIGTSSIISARQQPITKLLSNDASIIDAGIPEDYKNNITALDKLTEYAYFVKHQVYAINQTEDFFNIYSTGKFSNQYVDNSWVDELSIKLDFSDLEHGIFFELRKILYLSGSVEEAENNIINLWKHHSTDQEHLMNGYYQLLGIPVPDELTEIGHSSQYYTKNPKNLSIFLF